MPRIIEAIVSSTICRRPCRSVGLHGEIDEVSRDGADERHGEAEADCPGPATACSRGRCGRSTSSRSP
jgi:hypothetical protein